jgi:hypothetical protein
LGIIATHEELSVLWLNHDQSDGMVLGWKHAPDANATKSTSVVDSLAVDVQAVHAAGFPGPNATAPVDGNNNEVGNVERARRMASVMSQQDLSSMHLTSEEVQVLLNAASEPANELLLRRLTGVVEIAHELQRQTIAALPSLVARDLLLRALATGNNFESEPWLNYFATTTDNNVLLAVLRARNQGANITSRELLVARVRAQAGGTTPIEGDALLQHRLMTAVFDATDLSPTVLRPFAVALRPRLDAFTGGPVERFIARHGVIRR